MLDIGFWELVTVGIIALLVLKPEDMPELLRAAGKALRKLREYSNEITSVFRDATQEVAKPLNEIIDLDGNPQPAYDVKEIEELRKKG